MGHGLPFRPGSFDGCISVSALQWLCNSDSTAPSSSPALRLSRFFTTLFAALSRGSKAVFQFYPECDDQVRFIMDGARKAGFGGGLVVDYPNSQKAKKFYLVLMTGTPSGGAAKVEEMPKALGVDEGGRADPGARKVKSSSTKRGSGKGGRSGESKKVWIQHKKELYRSRGKEDVPRDSKFTGRRRRTQF